MKIGIIGLGYVGIPLLLSIVKAGYEVIGFDINDEVVEKLNSKKCHLHQWEGPFSRVIKPGYNAHFSANPEILRHADIAIVCVPTPVSQDSMPDHSYVDRSLKTLSSHFNGHLLMLESTVSPGYTRSAAQKYFGDKLVHNGGTLSLCFSPEREDPGNEQFSNVEIPKVIGGMTPQCLELGLNFYVKIFEHVAKASSLEAAEFCKVHENTFRAINISYVNQVRNLTAKLGVDFEEIVNLAKTKPFGFMPFHSGVGVGGHCIPVDPYFMLKIAADNQVNFSMIEAAMEEIEISPSATAKWLTEEVPDKSLLITGAAYKDGVSDIRCSPALNLIETLCETHNVCFWDPHVSEITAGGKKMFSMTKQEVADFDGCIIIVNEAGRKLVQHEKVRSNAIVDARYRKWL